MAKISPAAWFAQWEHLTHTFELNIWNFEAEVGHTAVKTFTRSFEMGRFNSSGSKAWSLTKGKRNKAGNPRGCLLESFSLKNSIQYIIHDLNTPRDTVRVYTSPTAFGNSLSHRGFCYAAVHNSDPKDGLRTGKVANMPQRQFMPTDDRQSTVLDDKLLKMGRMVFTGFPGVYPYRP